MKLFHDVLINSPKGSLHYKRNVNKDSLVSWEGLFIRSY